MVILNEVKDLLFPLLCKEGLGGIRLAPDLIRGRGLMALPA